MSQKRLREEQFEYEPASQEQQEDEEEDQPEPFEPSDAERDFDNQLDTEQQNEAVASSMMFVSGRLQDDVRRTEQQLRLQPERRPSYLFTEPQPVLLFAHDLDNLTTAQRIGEMRNWNEHHRLDRKSPLQEPLELEYIYSPQLNNGLLGLREGHHRLLRLEELGRDYQLDYVLAPTTVLVRRAVPSLEQEAKEHPYYKWLSPPQPLADPNGYVPSKQITPYDLGLPTVSLSDHVALPLTSPLPREAQEEAPLSPSSPVSPTSSPYFFYYYFY